MDEVDAGHRFEELDTEMRGSPDAGGAVADLAGIRLRVGDELGDRGGRHGRMDRHHVRRGADEADVRDAADRIVAQALVKGRPDPMRADVAKHERVAIGRGLRGQLRGDGAAGARPVFHGDRRIPDLRQARGGDARRLVDAAAGNEADVELGRLAGERLRRRGGGTER